MTLTVDLDNPTVGIVNALIEQRAKLSKSERRTEVMLTEVIEDLTQVLLKRDQKELLRARAKAYTQS